MRALLIGLAAVLLAACASPPQQLAAAADRAPALIATATLATNACEAAVAPAYTAAIHGVRLATARVKAGTLAVDRAEQIAQLGRAARADLDAACPGGTLDPPRLAAAQAAVARIRSLLGG